jgi:hypothetical protein
MEGSSTPLIVQNGLQFAFAPVKDAARYTQIVQVMAFCNTVVPAETTFDPKA